MQTLATYVKIKYNEKEKTYEVHQSYIIIKNDGGKIEKLRLWSIVGEKMKTVDEAYELIRKLKYIRID
jgi:hypothetical protein